MTTKKLTYAVRIIDSTGSVRIPKIVRSIVGMDKGTPVTISVEGDKVIIERSNEAENKCQNCGH
ncbi:MAG: AbrB/MazE/SpoVT family DNA-binding domain-containing protein [Defluviitaleaceae bacterium]|nr:AbrB/MazE/SpoVT family DNA-binding domain-containing protein [Defluviitaleaceae bacterium]